MRRFPMGPVRISSLRSNLRLAAALAVAMCLGARADAGSGRVNADGSIDITVNIRFPITAVILANVEAEITVASRMLYDASEGQLSLGKVLITCTTTNQDQADVWLYAEARGSYAAVDCDATVLGRSGYHVTQYDGLGRFGPVLAHELGHLALGLLDEYPKSGDCWGANVCIQEDGVTVTERNQCLMQQAPGFTWTEFCVPSNHDLVRGDGLSCSARAVGACTANCELYNHSTGNYETTDQEAACSIDCWSSLAANFSFLRAPSGLPVQAEPAGFTPPVYAEDCDAADGVLLVLDKSGSMGWSAISDDGEVCSNGIDDDEDGTVDETDDCAMTRLSFLQASARAWLTLAETAGMHAGIVTFEDTAELLEGLRPLDAVSATDLRNAIDGLLPGNFTAIGDGLRVTIPAFTGYEATLGSSLNKAAFLISDGKNTRGEDPSAVIPDVRAAGIRIYTLSTGDASDDATLATVSSATRGSHVDSRDVTELVAATAQQWARYRNAGVLIPKLPYSVDARNANFPSDPKKPRTGDEWAASVAADRTPPYPVNDYFRFRAEEGMRQAVMMLAGDMRDMSGFGVRVRLAGPAGPGPDRFDSEAPAPSDAPWIRVVRDRYFVIVELRHPNPGDWLLEVRSGTGAAVIQTGNLTVFADNPNVDFIAGVDPMVVDSPGTPVRLDVLPSFATPLMNLPVIDANLRRPDGSSISLTLSDTRDQGTYIANITETPFRGFYQIRMRVRTGPGTFNHPGEARPAGLPPASLPVPRFERTAVEYFFVRNGAHVCRSGDPKDCDGDGVPGESEVTDTDGDNVPDAFDADSDGDEIPDGNEYPGEPRDLDGDNIPDHLDPDADGDKVPDGNDPSISLGEPIPELRFPDLELTACGKLSRERTARIVLWSEEPVSGFTFGLEGIPSKLIEVLDVRPGAAIPAGGVESFQVVRAGEGKLLVSLALEPGVLVGPGRDLSVAEVALVPGPAASPGLSALFCFADGIGNPPGEMKIIVLKNGQPASSKPRTRCGKLTFVPDRIPPAISCRVEVEDTCSPDGSKVGYEVRAVDDCGDVSVKCSFEPGTFFKPGDYFLICEAIDESQNLSTCAVPFTVGDRTPPRVIVPEPILIDCPGPNGAAVNYEVKAEDDCGKIAKLSCNPPSGSFFPIGETLVECEAVDAAGNRATRGFLVILRKGNCPGGFKRGDSNGDGTVDISDGVRTLTFLFLGGDPLDCFEAANSDDSADLDITDAVVTFAFLFLGGPPPPAPGHETCGSDPTPPDLGPCRYEKCD